MTITPFRVKPVAIVTEYANSKEVRLAAELELEEVEMAATPTTLVNITFSDHGRSLPVAEIINHDPDELVWLGAEGSVFTARRIKPSDAPLANVYGYDLPEAVLAAMAYGQLENPMQLQAIVDEDTNRVMTLLLSTDAGLYARYDTLWHPVTDPEVFDGSYMIDVYEDSIQLYDAADSVGSQVAAAALPTSANEFEVGTPMPTDEPATTPFVAAAIPIIEDANQLQETIPLGAENPSLRWYIEKRAQALGVEVEFPWT
jgi:hypothetical protein